MLWSTVILVFVAILVETLSLYLQHKDKKLTLWFKNFDFIVHSLITVLLWTAMGISFILLQFKEQLYFEKFISPDILTYFTAAGWIILAGGLTVSIWGFIRLGPRRSLGLNFFREDVPVVKNSIYKYINNPETGGLCWALFGFSFVTGSVYNFFIALEFTVLMVFHTKLENITVRDRFE
ncbi:MAG: methyltransferase [Elusimicrobiota bacterium]